MYQFVPLSSDSSIFISSVGLVPDTTVTGIVTVKFEPKTGVTAAVVVVVVIAALATSVTCCGDCIQAELIATEQSAYKLSVRPIRLMLLFLLL